MKRHSCSSLDYQYSEMATADELCAHDEQVPQTPTATDTHHHPRTPTTQEHPPPKNTHHPRTPTTQEHPPPKNTHHPRTPTTQEHPPPKNTHHPRTPTTQEHPPPKNTHHPRTPTPKNTHPKTPTSHYGSSHFLSNGTLFMGVPSSSVFFS